MRLLRGRGYGAQEETHKETVVTAPDAAHAAAYLNNTEGNIFLATGSKELSEFCENLDDVSRVTARVLPAAEALSVCRTAGLSGKQVIAMQGPFTEEINLAMLKHTSAKYLVTKDGGTAGGYYEKAAAAEKLGITVVLLSRPEEKKGYSFDEIVTILQIKGSGAGTISLVGAGMGDGGTLTREGEKAVKQADLIIGSKRLTESLSDMFSGKEVFVEYHAEKICSCLAAQAEGKNAVVLLSGDTGFYSGAKGIIERLERAGEKNLRVIPGVATPACLAARLKTDWQDMKLISLHGRSQNAVAAVKRNQKTFMLLNRDGAGEAAKLFLKYGLENVTMHVASDLGTKQEKIVSGAPQDFVDSTEMGLCAAVVENPDAESYVVTYGMEEDRFVRGDVPMTKPEVRAVSLSKLRLTRTSVVYDIGAGTGSVAVECALQAYDGTVYAIEKNKAAAELIQKNKKKHGAANLKIIQGSAPEALDRLEEAPTHVFIGGSAGKLSQIIDAVAAQNKNVRIVINAITTETLFEAIEIIKRTKTAAADIVRISVEHERKLGASHMMSPCNPVWIITIQMGND